MRLFVDTRRLAAATAGMMFLVASASAVSAFESVPAAQASAESGRDGSIEIVVSKGLGGQVTVVGWNQLRSEVTVRRADGDSSGIALTKTVGNGRTLFTVTAPDPTFLERVGLRSRQIDLTAYVPEESRLSVSMDNGPISIHGVVGPLHVDSSNGPIEIGDAGSTVHAHCANGAISVAITHLNAVPDVDLSLTNGPIELRVPKGFSAKVAARTTFGPVDNALASNVGPGHVNLRVWAGPIDVTTSR